MPKTTKKETTTKKKATVNHTTEDMKKSVQESADKIWIEGKKAIWKLQSRWGKSSTEEKVSVILGLIFLVIALGMLWELIWGMVFLILWVLWVTCFFVNKENKK